MKERFNIIIIINQVNLYTQHELDFSHYHIPNLYLNRKKHLLHPFILYPHINQGINLYLFLSNLCSRLNHLKIFNALNE